MRYCFFLFSVFLSGAVALPAQTTIGLVAYYTLDSIYRDVTGNTANTGTPAGGPYFTCGAERDALFLDGQDDEVVILSGPVNDEFDDEDLVFSKLDDQNFVFEGKTPLKDFYKVIKLEDPKLFEDAKGEAETLAGFILEVTKGFPKKDEILNFHQYSFTIESFENKRIKQIKLTIHV